MDSNTLRHCGWYMASNRKELTEVKHKITDIVKNNAYLISYQKGILLYSIAVVDDGGPDIEKVTSYSFPIDTTNKADVGEGEFRRVEKGIMLLRWLSRAITDGTVRVAETEVNVNGG